MDLWSVKETWLDRFYERYGFPVQLGWTVIDVGAGIGDFTMWAATHGAARIDAYEPDAEAAAIFLANLRSNQIEGATLLMEAFAARAGFGQLDPHESEPLMRGVRSEGTDASGIPCVTLEQALDRLPDGRCDLLKLDCEGGEFEILLGASRATLQRVSRIVLEYHDHLTSHRHPELVRHLRDSGYRVETFSNPAHAYLGYLRAERRG